MENRAKQKTLRSAAMLLLVFVLLLAGCGKQGEHGNNNTVTVCLEQGRGFAAKSYFCTVTEQGDAVFELRPQENFEIIDCSYEDYSVALAENGYTLLTLHSVKYPCRVELTCEIPTTVILYDPNGGSFAETGSEEPMRIACGPSVHPRLNTLSGATELSREGYVLTGWNTEPDGSGQHIGLGSRVTAEKNGTLTLYAQWEKAADPSLFTFVSEENGICLTEYLGGSTHLMVIPEELEGQPVTAIGAGFAREITLGALVLPKALQTIEEGAFQSCTIEDITLFDTLTRVSDASFPDSRPRYWHINAALQPRYQAISDITTFADKMDLLLLCESEKKLVLFSGCSMNYGVDSSLLQEAYPDYTVLNLGAVGGSNALFQFEIMLPCIHEGDVFLHAPEEASAYQLMSDISCENRMFIAVEGNFDLLSAVDMTTLGEGAFDSFAAFNAKRTLLEPCSYEDQYIPLNDFGDNAEYRAANNSKRFDEEYGLRPWLLTEEGMDLLALCYDRIREAGGSVFLSYAPINALCCSEEEIAEFSQAWEQGMETRGYETVSCLEDYVLEARYFYDSDYHLTTAGAELRTEQLIADLQEAIR